MSKDPLHPFWRRTIMRHCDDANRYRGRQISSHDDSLGSAFLNGLVIGFIFSAIVIGFLLFAEG